MRETRKAQTSIFDCYAKHEIGNQLAMAPIRDFGGAGSHNVLTSPDSMISQNDRQYLVSRSWRACPLHRVLDTGNYRESPTRPPLNSWQVKTEMILRYPIHKIN